MSLSDGALVSPADDNFHMGPDRSQSDGSWWGFYVPERRLGGWFYHLTKLNLGIASGGVWIWDDTASSCFEIPYFLNETLQLLPPGEHDLNDFTWPDGSSLKTIEPLTRYQLSFSDRDVLSLDLEYSAVAPPFVSAEGEPRKAFRMEQPCRVLGELNLHGERIAVNSIGMRDHSWMLRPEHIRSRTPLSRENPKSLGERPIVYLFANATEADGFWISPFKTGYLTRDGIRADLISPKQTIERDPADGHVTRMVVEGKDELGRNLEATGTTLSWMIRHGNHGVGLIHLMEWQFNGTTGWGDTQDIWPVDQWSFYRAWQRRQQAAGHRT